MAIFCCHKIENGKLVARQCFTDPFGESCPRGWEGGKVKNCEECPSYPCSSKGSKSEAIGSPSVNILADVSQRLAFVQGQLSVLGMTGAPDSRPPTDPEAPRQEPLDLNPLFDNLEFAIAQAPFCDEEVEKLTAFVDQARSGDDSFQMLQNVCDAAASGLEGIGPGAYDDDDPLNALHVRAFFEVISAVRLLPEMMKAPTDSLPEPKRNRKCKGKPLTCQHESRWRCMQIREGCVSVGPKK